MAMRMSQGRSGGEPSSLPLSSKFPSCYTLYPVDISKEEKGGGHLLNHVPSGKNNALLKKKSRFSFGFRYPLVGGHFVVVSPQSRIFFPIDFLRERKRNIDVRHINWLPPSCTPTGARDRTQDTSVCRPMLSPLSSTSQG